MFQREWNRVALSAMPKVQSTQLFRIQYYMRGGPLAIVPSSESYSLTYCQLLVAHFIKNVLYLIPQEWSLISYVEFVCLFWSLLQRFFSGFFVFPPFTMPGPKKFISPKTVLLPLVQTKLFLFTPQSLYTQPLVYIYILIWSRLL